MRRGWHRSGMSAKRTGNCVAWLGLGHAEIATSCGMVLDLRRNLYDYPVSDRDTLTVILVPADDLSVSDAEVRESA